MTQRRRDGTRRLSKSGSRGLRHRGLMVPWILANVTEEEEAELRSGAPKLLSVLHDHVWEQRFRRVMAPLYGTSTG